MTRPPGVVAAPDGLRPLTTLTVGDALSEWHFVTGFAEEPSFVCFKTPEYYEVVAKLLFNKTKDFRGFLRPTLSH